MKITNGFNDFPEKQLVLRVQEGDRDSFNSLAEEYRPFLTHIAFRLLHNQEDARDAVQDSLIKALKSLSQFSSDRPIKPWLARICINNCIDHLRDQRNHRLLSVPLFEYLVDDRVGVQETIEQEMTIDAVRLAISQMPKRYRKILELRLLQQKPISEIAIELHTPEGTVKSWLFRARVQLQKSCVGAF